MIINNHQSISIHIFLLIYNYNSYLDILTSVYLYINLTQTGVRIIRDSLQTLEWLEGCLVPAIVTAYTDPHPNAYGHALMLVKHWMATVTQLQECLDLIMDPSAFSLVRILFIFSLFIYHPNPYSVCIHVFIYLFYTVFYSFN